jgi:hypothetical protein
LGQIRRGVLGFGHVRTGEPETEADNGRGSEADCGETAPAREPCGRHGRMLTAGPPGTVIERRGFINGIRHSLIINQQRPHMPR